MAKFSMYIICLYCSRNLIFKMLSNIIRKTVWN